MGALGRPAPLMRYALLRVSYTSNDLAPLPFAEWSPERNAAVAGVEKRVRQAAEATTPPAGVAREVRLGVVEWAKET